jgi:hypothetical protein
MALHRAQDSGGRRCKDDPVPDSVPASPAPPELDSLIPAGPGLVDALLAIAVPHVDIDEILAARTDVLVGERRERLARSVRLLAGAVDTADPVRLDHPVTDASAPPADRYLYLFAALAVLPSTREHHRRLGIPERISRATLADIGRNVAVYRLTYGHGGFSDIAWCRLHLTGNLYQLGRLQFERTTLGRRTAAAVAAAPDSPSPAARVGDPAIGVHIPRYYGPMDPASCDLSFAAAHEFFARHYPDDRPAVAVCRSWLLDDQLADYLPANSNIIRFARRFTPAYLPDDGDESTLRFVFGNPEVPLDRQPRHTRLERAVLDHLAAGGHWRGGVGWLAW